MVGGIKDSDTFWFCELYAVLAAFADEPANVISRIGQGRISIPEELYATVIAANELFDPREYLGPQRRNC